MPLPPSPTDTALLQAVALYGRAEPAPLAALTGWPVSEVRAQLQAQAAEVERLTDPVHGAAQRDAVLRAWLQQQPRLAPPALQRAMRGLLAEGRTPEAAHLAAEHGDPARQRELLAQAGWWLLLSPARPVLGRLLQALRLQPPLDDAVHALQLAWQVEVERLPHEAERGWQHRPLTDPALQALLQSRCAQMYDDPAAALALAQRAVQGLSPLHPAALLAQVALGFAWVDSGRPDDALAPLQQALRGGVRDGLVLLQLEALQVLARAHDERGDEHALQQCLDAAARLPLPSPTDLPAWDSLQRLVARRYIAQACWQPPLPQPTPPAELQEAPTPWLIVHGWKALAEGQHRVLREAVQRLQQRLAQTYVPQKWRHDVAWLALAVQRQPGPPAAPAASGPDLHGLQQAVWAAAAAWQADRPQPLPYLAALQQQLQQQGLQRLARRLALVRALQADDEAALAAWLDDEGTDPLDLLCLASGAVGPLQRLLGSPRCVAPGTGARVGPRARVLLQRLLGPRDEEPAHRPAASPPADLTPREWQVLQLIGQELSNEQIAQRLFVSVATVKTHINRLYAKLGVQQRVQAVWQARRLAADQPRDFGGSLTGAP